MNNAVHSIVPSPVHTPICPSTGVPTLDTSPDHAGTDQVQSALRNLLAAASQAAGAGTSHLVPHDQLSPTIASSVAVTCVGVLLARVLDTDCIMLLEVAVNQAIAVRSLSNG